MTEEEIVLTEEEAAEVFADEDWDSSDAVSDSVKLYLNQINEIPLLTIEEEKRLIAEGKIDQLVEHNLRLVVSIAKHYKGCGISFPFRRSRSHSSSLSDRQARWQNTCPSP